MVIAKLYLFRKPKIFNHSGQQKVIRVGQTCLCVMMRPSFVKKFGNHAFMAHHLLVISKSETSVSNTFADERRKQYESLVFIIFTLKS